MRAKWADKADRSAPPENPGNAAALRKRRGRARCRCWRTKPPERAASNRRADVVRRGPGPLFGATLHNEIPANDFRFDRRRRTIFPRTAREAPRWSFVEIAIGGEHRRLRGSKFSPPRFGRGKN